MTTGSKQPVIFDIEGTSYEVDAAHQLLRQTNNRGNTISFVHDMQDFGTYYRLDYDTERRRPDPHAGDNDWVKSIQVPQLTSLDPDGLAARYNKPVDEVRQLSDFEVMVDAGQLELRRKGVLPQIEIMGEQFVIDIRLQELRHAANFSPVISLLQLSISDDGQRLEAYYHPLLKTPVDVDPKLLELPDHIVRIGIPHELSLDPVAASRLYGIDERKLLRYFGMELHRKAAITPLADTRLPTLIRQNREELQRRHQEIARKVKPRRRPRF